MKKLVILIAVIVLGTTTASAQGKNYCHDPQTWQDWENIAREYPADVPLQILHALRIGLCEKVEAKSITLQEATGLINGWSEMLIQERQRSEAQNQKERL